MLIKCEFVSFNTLIPFRTLTNQRTYRPNYRVQSLIAAVALLTAVCTVDLSAQAGSKIDQLEWNTEKLAEGIYWKTYLGNDLFDSRQSINIIEISLDSSSVEYQLAWNENGLMKTSDFADQHNALAAVNGSFYGAEGESIVFMKADGEVISSGAVGGNPFTERGGFGWNRSGEPVIIPKPEEGWQSVQYENLLSAGPLLIYDNNVQNFNDDPFHQNRHPRTALALTSDNRLLLVTVDGRSFQSYGMTISELSRFLSGLDARYALNLDGGGSTSMWIRDKKNDGIVNYPSNNFEFDHEGERSVSNALIIRELNK